MAGIKVKGKILKITNEGLTKNGEPYRCFELSESFKRKNENGYDYTYWHCFAQGDESKKVSVDAIVTIEGVVTGKQNVVNGRKFDNKTLFVNNIISDNFTKNTTPKTEKEEEDKVALPFD